jgi:hypothetical protein
MVNKAYQMMVESGEQISAILIPGDFNTHGLPKHHWEDNTPNDKWPQMLETFRSVVQTLATRFPGVPILSAIGNNDCYYHD